MAALVAPVGPGLGVFVPTALDRLKGDDAAFAPWAWGVNGIFSVLAGARDGGGQSPAAGTNVSVVLTRLEETVVVEP